MSYFRPLAVQDIRRETRDAVVLTFAIPEPQLETFRFTQGQYLTLRTTLNGEEVRRSYSICAATGETLRVAVKRVPGGRFSQWANESIRPGQLIEAMPPMGDFFFPLTAGAKKHYLGIACGSGITPLLSIAKTTLAVERASRFTLVYGNRASSTVMFREELGDLKNAYLDRFNSAFIMTREQQEGDLFNGRIDREKCAALFRFWMDVSTVDGALLCGPAEMMREAAAALEAAGLPRMSIKKEHFTAGRAAGPFPEPGRPRKKGQCEVTVILDGRRSCLTIDKAPWPLLDAVIRQGVDLPYSCKGGVCATCRAKLIEGEVDMDGSFALEDYEIAGGFILCCQSYAATDRLVLDFDRHV